MGLHPFSKIISLSLNENADNSLALTVQLLENIRFEFLFQSSVKEEIKQLCETIYNNRKIFNWS